MKNIFLILLALLPLVAESQIEQPIGYAEYMEEVRTKNISLAAEKLNILISDANIRSARVFNDPSLSVEYANNENQRMQMGQGFSAELSKTFSVGQLSARVNLARSEKEMAIALFENYFRNLRASATIVYLEAIKQRELYTVMLNSYNSIAELAKADSIKFALGKITKTNALQSKLESGVIYNELMSAQANLYNSYAALNIPLGRFKADTLFVPKGALDIERRNFARINLLSMALENRADLVAALQNTDVAQKALSLVRRERNIDFDLAVGYNYNAEVSNELAPAPRFNGFTVGVAIPLKFSNFNKGAVLSASLKAAQAENYFKQAQLEVQTEVSQNYNAYVLGCVQVERFNKGMLEESKAVIDGKTYSYNRGETSLLEVLDAQRTYNEVRALYIETLFNHATSLVSLEQSVGFWDIELE